MAGHKGVKGINKQTRFNCVVWVCKHGIYTWIPGFSRIPQVDEKGNI